MLSVKIPTIKIPRQEILAELVHKIDHKTKPQGSLGRLEKLALQLGVIQQSTSPVVLSPAIIVFAGDHGIVAEGVSPFPQEVTFQMVSNFLAGGAAINVLARQSAVTLYIADAGVNHEFGETAGLINLKVASGTHNFLNQDAMSPAQAELAYDRGAALASGIISGGTNVLGFGEMGIGNTSSAAMLTHLITGISLEECTGAGTGLDAAGIAHKISVLRNSLTRFSPAGDRATIAEIITAYGGYEIIMMAGAMLEAASSSCAIVIDGFISTAAYLIARSIDSNIESYAIFSHMSQEKGHRLQLSWLKVSPILELELRLGEGSGVALAMPLLQAACAIINEMASFDSAGVSNR